MVCTHKQRQLQQEARGGNGSVSRPHQAVLTPAFRRRTADTAEYRQQRAESEAEAERIRQRSGQSASFASLYGTRVSVSQAAHSEHMLPYQAPEASDAVTNPAYCQHHVMRCMA